jgi:hypothetical protein
MDKTQYRELVQNVRDKLNAALLPLGEARYALEQTAKDGYYPDALGSLAHLLQEADEKTVAAFRHAEFAVASSLCHA